MEVSLSPHKDRDKCECVHGGACVGIAVNKDAEQQPKCRRSEEQESKKKFHDEAGAKSRINICCGFRWWRDPLKVKTDIKVFLYLHCGWIK